MLKWVLVATIMFVYALGIEAQGVLTPRWSIWRWTGRDCYRHSNPRCRSS